jgi:hypothetical protein
MGWFNEHHDHEGYVIALVTREGTLRGSGLYRALCGPLDRNLDVEIERIGAECVCGWRSPHWTPLRRAWTGKSGDHFALEWAMFSPIVSPDDDERAYQEWKRHVSDVDTRGNESGSPYPPLCVVPEPATQPDDPAGHMCALLDEPRCWLKRRPEEDGQRVSAQPCDTYRAYCIAPGYCWCGHFRTRHGGHADERANKPYKT